MFSSDTYFTGVKALEHVHTGDKGKFSRESTSLTVHHPHRSSLSSATLQPTSSNIDHSGILACSQRRVACLVTYFYSFQWLCGDTVSSFDR